jgi:hypothetical protein
MKRITALMTLLIAAIIFSISFSSCKEKGPKLSTTPEALVEKMINNPAFKSSPNGEGFCWQANVGATQYVDNYEVTGDTKWLDAGVRYFDFLIGRMTSDPDGYKGWIGERTRSGRTTCTDALVGDAILLSSILNFAILVNENQALKSKYGEKAQSYIAVAKKDFVEKWDHRGSWIEDVPFATWAGVFPFTKDSTGKKQWMNRTQIGMSNPFNKLFDAAEVCLDLWKLTGEKVYWDKAEKIFFTAKNHFQYFDNHYCSNYFEPLYPGDVDLQRKSTRHGIWVHPWRSGYQAGEIEKIVEAYHNGMVFDEQDIKRLINTNLKVMWNGDKVNPKYISSNGLGADGDTTGLAAFKRQYGHSNATKNSGELWTALLDFDQTIRDLYELRFKGDTTSERYLYYKKTILANPPGFKRKYVKGEVTVPVVNFTECKDLNCSVVLPHIVPKDGKSIIFCQSWIPGDLKIELYSTKGDLVTTLYKGKINQGQFMIEWDGKDPAKKADLKGDYKVRWTINGGCREFPVVI